MECCICRLLLARAGMPEYWIVDPVARTIEVLMLVDAVYQQLGVASGEELVASNVIPSLELKAAQYFTR
jgi:Uma2 family endonuclease